MVIYKNITLCWIASFMNPIIMDAHYQMLKEKAKKLTQKRDIRAMTILKKCRKFKIQTVTFHKIELGYFYNIKSSVFLSPICLVVLLPFAL